ncbi:hypothetical protein AVEN_210495-1 [Araneus ventricosus]|uniref:Uncharacterized protein n=1 Tax=Araneus ventricosus TaxID=182803 RepID=A0A4Y2W5Z2_ARAVE|nr:hypothetical protein AVEN_210495-1 [Araneus ventricosus]
MTRRRPGTKRLNALTCDSGQEGQPGRRVKTSPHSRTWKFRGGAAARRYLYLLTVQNYQEVQRYFRVAMKWAVNLIKFMVLLYHNAMGISSYATQIDPKTSSTG